MKEFALVLMLIVIFGDGWAANTTANECPMARVIKNCMAFGISDTEIVRPLLKETFKHISEDSL
jgi:hypothetical protein